MSFEFIAADLADRAARNLHRQQIVVEQSDAGRVKIAGRWYHNFSGNDYLGLAESEALRACACDAAGRYPPGSSASPLVTGYSVSHQRLEDYLCQRLNRERVLLFNSGFAANQALIHALMRRGGLILADKLSHASMLDGALASGARLKRFAHNDAPHLHRLLTNNPGEDTLVITEGVFSMDGDQAPVTAIAEHATDAGALLFLDDAHGFGVLGETGAGTVEALNLDQQSLPVLMATFGKAVGTGGAFAALSAQLYDYMVNFARHYIYSTAMSPLLAEITLASLRLVEQQHWRRQKLDENIQYFRQTAVTAGLPVSPSVTAIQPVIVGPSDAAIALAETLQHQGFWVRAMRAPTVPEGSARLRVTINSLQKKSNIKRLVEAIGEGLKHDR